MSYILAVVLTFVIKLRFLKSLSIAQLIYIYVYIYFRQPSKSILIYHSKNQFIN